jgi:hypothetical protein
MIKKQLLSKALCAALFAASMLFGSSVFAQVKIGTNPTTIEPNSNLEVEASTTGRKVKVDKTTGQMTIADGTQGTGKVLTSDANGGASWQLPLAQNTDVWVYAKQTGSQAISVGTNLVLFNSEVYDRGNNFNPATSTITVPSDGIYQLSAGTKKSTAAASTFNMLLEVWVNGTLFVVLYEDGSTEGSLAPRATGAITLQLSAGDVVDVRLKTNFYTYSIAESYLTFVKLSK